MKKNTTIAVIFFTLGFCSSASIAEAQSESFPKLPYAAGQSFIVTQGFHTPPTHIKKDDFAIDFTQNGCAAYAKLAVAAVAGKAWIVQDSGYNGGYGTQLMILGDGNIVTRYAHLISDSVTVKIGDDVPQGMPIGLIGDTGLVAGTACGSHPGTHIHFAMDTENTDESFSAKDPEPISGYTDIEPGQWYLSDNTLTADAPSEKELTAAAHDAVGGTSQNGLQNSQDIAGAGDTSLMNSANNQVSASPGGVVASVDGQSFVSASSGLAMSGADDQPQPGGSSATPLSSPQETSSSVAGEQTTLASGDSSGSVGNPVTKPIGGITALLPVPASGSSSAAAVAISDASSSAVEFSSSTEASSSPNFASTTDGTGEEVATSSQPIVMTSSTTLVATASSSDVVASSSFFLDSPSAIGADSLASFNSSTLAIDFDWQSPQNASSSSSFIYSLFLIGKDNSSSIFIASTTLNSFSYPIPDMDFGGKDSFAIQATDVAGDQSAPATTTVAIPNWFSTVQPVLDDDSRPSWYSDNWYDLGTGFHGTIRSLTLEGFVNSDLFGSSEVALEEFLDAGYAVLDHTFSISPTPFAQTTAKITVSGLKIPLSPEKYYRLTTLQSYQNRSVILKGTDATGTAMFDEFAFGIGGIQHTYPFYPYLSAIIDPQKLILAPPSLSGNLRVSFDATNSKINVSWPAAIDADEPLVPPSYQINISTSTSLDAAQWQSIGTDLSASFDVVLPNSYTIGVRALDDFESSSAPITVSWNFPVDYAPVPLQFDHSVSLGDQGGTQVVTFLATTTASAIDFWMAPVRGIFCCSQTYLSIYKDDGGVRGAEVSSGNPVFTFGPFDGGGEVTYPFSDPITFSPGKYWFTVAIGPSGITNPTTIYGSRGDSYPGGSWSATPSQDAYLRIVKTNGP